MQIELVIKRHFEGLTNDNSTAMERRSTQLSTDFSNPLDILRKINTATWKSNYRDLLSEDEYSRGIWGLPLLWRSLSFVRGLFGSGATKTIAQHMVSMLPDVASKIA